MVNGLTFQKWRLNFRSKIPYLCFFEEILSFNSIPNLDVFRSSIGWVCAHNLGQVYCWTWLLKWILSMLIKGETWSFFFPDFWVNSRDMLGDPWYTLGRLWAVYCKHVFFNYQLHRTSRLFQQLVSHKVIIAYNDDFYNSHFETEFNHESAHIFCSWSM